MTVNLIYNEYFVLEAFTKKMQYSKSTFTLDVTPCSVIEMYGLVGGKLLSPGSSSVIVYLEHGTSSPKRP